MMDIRSVPSLKSHLSPHHTMRTINLILSVIISLGVFFLLETNARYCHEEGSNIVNASTNDYILSYVQAVLPMHIGALDEPTSVVTAPTGANIDTTSLTVDDLRYYYYMSSAMYCPFGLQDNISCCICGHFNSTITEHKIFENNTLATKVLVTYHKSKNEIVVTSRGSISIMNWIMDADLLPVHIGGPGNIKIHQGMFLSTMSIYYQVVFQLLQWLHLYPHVSRIVLTGHSLGGGMAQLMTFFFTHLDQFPSVNLVLVTYGSPRCGNKGFADYMNSLTIPAVRVTNRADLVVHMPPVSGFLPLITGEFYYHTMREVWLNGSDIHFCVTDKYEDPTCAMQMDPFVSIIDHVNYFGIDITFCYLFEGNLLDIITVPGVGPGSAILPAIPQKVYEIMGYIDETLIHHMLYPLFG